MKGFGKYNLVCGIDFVEKSLPHCCFESADQQLDQRRPHPLDFARLRNDKMQTRDIYIVTPRLVYFFGNISLSCAEFDENVDR